MVSLKLSRTGKTKKPYFRLIAIDKQKDPWGKFIEILGHYDPRTKKTEFKADRIKYWLSKGAQPTDTVRNMLITQNIIEGKKVRVTTISKKRKEKLDKAAEKKA